MGTARRSPLSQPPLNLPGESVHRHQVDVVLDDMLVPVMIALFLVSLWLLDVWRAYRDIPPAPWLSGALALAGIIYAAWKMRRSLPTIRRLRLAREGERSVGQGLEQLRRSGYLVYHDIPGVDFNLDHVLIGPSGIFTIETKTWSKPINESPTILVESESITINGVKPLRDPVRQARAQSEWIADILRKSTAHIFPVMPAVVFPGWWVELRTKPKGLWILNDKMLPGFLAKEPIRLSPEEVAMAGAHLEAYVRSRQQAL